MKGFSRFLTNTTNKFKGWFGLENDSMTEVFSRQQNNLQILSIYEGNLPEQLKVKQGQPNDNIFINYPQLIVDKGVAFLFGRELLISIGSETDNLDEDYLDSIWGKEQRQLDLIELATDGAIFGTAYLKIQIDQFGKPQIIVPDPANYFIETNPNNYLEIWKYVNQYQRRKDDEIIWYKEETSLENGRWIIREFESAEGDVWNQIGEDIVWKYSFAPVFACKNLPKSKSFYGKPDLHKSVIEICNYLARIDSLTGKIIRVHASPKPYAKGLQKQDLQLGTEDTLFLGTNPDAQLALLEMTGDLAGAMAFRKQLRGALAEISKVPEVSSGKVENIGQLSGFALQILYGPLIEQTLIKQRLYGMTIKNVIAALLEIGGKEHKKIHLNWSNPLPSNAKEEAETAILQKQYGVSDNTLLKNNGFDPKHEKEMKSEETESLGNALGRAFDGGLDE